MGLNAPWKMVAQDVSVLTAKVTRPVSQCVGQMANHMAPNVSSDRLHAEVRRILKWHTLENAEKVACAVFDTSDSSVISIRN